MKPKKTIEILLIELYDEKVITAVQYHQLLEAIKEKVRETQEMFGVVLPESVKIEYSSKDNREDARDKPEWLSN